MHAASWFRSPPFLLAFRAIGLLLSLPIAGLASAQEFTLRQQLGAVASGEGAPDGLFGWDVAVDGDIAVACDVRIDGSPARVRTYRRNGEAWQRLPDHDLVLDGDSGCRLAFADDTLILSAYRSAAPSRGYLSILHFDEGGWTTEYAISSSSAYYDAVATSGSHAVAGEPLYDGPGGDGQGRVRALSRDSGGHWSAQSLTAPTPQANAYFGTAVAIVSGAIAVSAPAMDILDGGTLRADAGAAYVYELTIDTWNLAASLTEPTGTIGAGHRFGSAVAIGGLDSGTPDRLLVSAPSDAASNHHGVVYGFRRGTSTWEPALSFSLSGGPVDDRYGCTLAVDGPWVVVGVCSSASAGANAGAVSIIKFDDGFTSILASALRTDPAAAPDDYFGQRVGIDRDGPTVIVGNLQADLYGNENQGVVVIGHANDGTPPMLARAIDLGQGLTNADAGAVAVDGNAMLIGAYGEATGSQHYRGAAYVYRRGSDGQYAFEARLLAPDGLAGDSFGFSVALRGDVALIGAIGRGLGGVEAAGAVYVFHRAAGSWSLEAVLLPDTPEDNTSFGLSLAFDGTTAMIGERREHVGVYARSAQGAWTRVQDLDRSGYESIALSGDRAALGNPAAGAGGNTAGEVALYERVGGTWQLDDVISGAAAGQEFGDEVSLDGDLLAVASNGEHMPALLYRRGGNGWLPDGVLLPDDLGARERCHHVAVRDERVAIGCWDHPADSGDSAVYVYARSAGTWQLEQKLLPPGGEPYEAFGYSVAWQGGYLYAGSLGRTIDFHSQGAVYVFVGDSIFGDGFE
jgi:hypothetical protein